MAAATSSIPRDRIFAVAPKNLSSSELRELFERWQQGGDARARTRLVERFMPLARSLAKRYANSHESLDDLVGVANLGLVKAIDRFDASREVSFTSYAVPTILGELRRYFRDTGRGVHVPRGRQEAAQQVEKATKFLAEGQGMEPSPQLIAEYLEWPLEDVIAALEAGAAHFSSSLDAPARDGDDEVGTVLSTIGTVDDGYEMVDARLTLAHAVGALPPRTRQILAMRFAEDLTQLQIANRLGVSQMQISRVLRSALHEVRALTTPA